MQDIFVSVMLLLPLMANGAKLSIDTVLTNFEHRITSDRVTEDFQTIDPATQTEIETQDLLSIRNKIRIYPSKGILVSNNVLDLNIPTQKLKSLSASVDKLVQVSPSDTYVKTLVKKNQKVEKFFNFGKRFTCSLNIKYYDRSLVMIIILQEYFFSDYPLQ